MKEPSAIGDENPKKSPKKTLGDVLYAASKAPASEEEWARLVQAIAAGDQIALHALYERAHRFVFTLILRITADQETAEELTVEVFHDIWLGAARYDAANGTVLGWIMNQAHARATDRLRSNGGTRGNGGDGPPPDRAAADPHDRPGLSDQRESLCAALTALTPDERQAIETIFFAGLTHAEAAARLNVPLGTIRTSIRSGLYKLRRALTGEAGKL